MSKFSPIIPKADYFLHGADYNPEQWLDRPDILEQDIQLMKQTHCNVMSVGIFSWASLEPREGEFNFQWMDEVLDRLADNGISVFLATPSGARPAWLSQTYPDVLRVDKNLIKQRHGGRHNHCYNSPNYREKVRIMNTRLAERYSQHPAVIGWHISNEYSGECHCEHCQEGFRNWLKARYQTLDNLNAKWWTTFWSHTYSDWSQLESPTPIGENSVHGHNLDWHRFCSESATDFCREEIVPLKAVNPDLPVTANFMEFFYDYDYWKFSEVIDVVSWDNYPLWHKDTDELGVASYIAMCHDLMRSLKDQPFLLMESTPSQTNWQPITKLKKPGMHKLSSLQAVAHGADSVQYFQWRKSRGSLEKFHGAVIDHVGHANTRTGKEVAEVGAVLEQISSACGSRTESEVAIIFDWESRWAMDDASGPRNQGLFYEQTVADHYRGFWEQGINCDVIEQLCDFERYKVVVAPMLYMIKPGVAERLEAFVNRGGVLVATYWSGVVDEHDLCFLGGFPGGANSPLRKTMGIWAEEIDSLYEEERVKFDVEALETLGMSGQYQAKHLMEHVHLETADVLATFSENIFSGSPMVTCNKYGTGEAYYLAARTDAEFNREFYKGIANTAMLTRVAGELPFGISLTTRHDATNQYIFVMNFLNQENIFKVPDENWINILTNQEVSDSNVTLSPYDVVIFKCQK